MNRFHYKNKELHAESVSLSSIASQFGTPCYVYSRAALTDAYRGFDAAFAGHSHLVCYAVKANSNIAILNVLARLGSGFDIVSLGELERVIAAGGDARKVVFSGVGKTAAELEKALAAGILCFNVESESELILLNRVALDAGKQAPVSVRVNPDVDAGTHPYIATGLKQNKFGVAYGQALPLYLKARALPNLQITGIDCHIGSQITDAAPFGDALARILALADRLAGEGIGISHIDIGGGLGIRYGAEAAVDVGAYAMSLLRIFGARAQKLLLEPGRVLVGNAGALLTRVQYLKRGADRNFAVVDAAMNDLLRPALYDAYHEILPLHEAAAEGDIYEVVGPVCETGDFLGHDRRLAVMEGDLLAVMSAGAYGMSMSSNYNTRPRAAEVVVDGDRCHLVRPRENVSDLFSAERLLP